MQNLWSYPFLRAPATDNIFSGLYDYAEYIDLGGLVLGHFLEFDRFLFAIVMELLVPWHRFGFVSLWSVPGQCFDAQLGLVAGVPMPLLPAP